MKRLFIVLAFLLVAVPSFAACPSGANYLHVTPTNHSGLPLVTLSTLGITTCHYISKSAGSDTNAGTSEASPWAHAPGMNSCSNSCASYTPSAGDGFIFEGGSAFTSADLAWIYKGAFGTGTSSNPVYFGVDKTWFSGASWARPTFTCGAGTCSLPDLGSYIRTGTSQYLIYDNFEFTGMHEASVGSYIQLGGNNQVIENMYAHGWEHTGASSDGGTCFNSETGTGDIAAYDICDGSDTTKDAVTAFGGDWAAISYSVAEWVTNGQNGSASQIHDTYICHIPPAFVGVSHQNGMQIAGPVGSDTKGFVYNDVMCDVQDAGMGHYWIAQSNNSGMTWYEFNNVMFDVAPGNLINFSQNTSSGTHWMFNNTFECGSVALGFTYCVNGANVTVPLNLHLINNHVISNVAGSLSNGVGSGLTLSESTTLAQTYTAASGQGYTEGSKDALQPTTGGSTVNAGFSEQSLCSTIAAIDSGAGTACQAATGYACAYNTSNHTVSCPNLPLVARPTSAAWDIGAYQFSGSQAQVPQPPSNLQATVL